MFTFQSTLPVRGATAPGNCTRRNPNISIHAPRTGSDPPRRSAETANSYFNPRSPCGERPLCGLRCTAQVHFNPRSPCGERRLPGVISQPFCLFQSTLPVRGATGEICVDNSEPKFQSTLPVRGATRRGMQAHCAAVYFNPRSPCGERPFWEDLHNGKAKFQSTLPVRGATCWPLRRMKQIGHFNPRSPCGERRTCRTMPCRRWRFQSTLPVRGATINTRIPHLRQNISIHAPRAGSDSNILCFCKLKAQYILNQLF